MVAQNNPEKYEQLWQQVSQYDEDDLPQSAAKEVEDILKQAIAEKNTQQVIKSLLVKNIYKIKIDKKNNTAIFADLNQLLAETKDEAYKALLNSLLAELYNDYYNWNRWNFYNRTALTDVVPEDIKEWSGSNFSDKVLEHLKQSVANSEVLKKHTTKEFDNIIVLGDNSPAYYPTLYDFLMKRAIEEAQKTPTEDYYRSIEHTGFSSSQLAVPADEYILIDIKEKPNTLALYYYKQYFNDLLARGMTSTVILTEINKANYLSELSYDFSNNSLLDFYKQLAEKYKDNETNAAVVENIARLLLSSSNYSYKYGYEYAVDYDSYNPASTEEAYNLCQKAVANYPNYPLISNIKEIIKALEKPYLDIKGNNIYYPTNEVVVDIRYRNLQALDEVPELMLSKNGGKTLKEYPANYKREKSYLLKDTTLNLGKLAPGKYQITEQSELDELIEFNFSVTRMAAFSRNNAPNCYQVYVVDRITGKPIEGATVSIYKRNEKNEDIKPESDKPLAQATTNAIGLASFKGIKELNGKDYFNGSYIVQYGEDIFPTQSVNTNYYFRSSYYEDNTPDADDQIISIFTDRGIYRPGQTVYFKGVVMNGLEKPVTNKKVTAKLKNNNNEIVGEKELRLNEFGSVAGEFTVPQSGLLGYYNIELRTERESETFSIQVEEYKRPTFEITFDKVEKTYTFGETVTVKGYAKNFSGISLQDATVEYTINKQQYSFWRYGGNTSAFDNGNVKTNADGSFEITFVPKAGENSSSIRYANSIQQYTINAKVTDLNNETQSGSFSLLVGDVSMAININIPLQLEKSDTVAVKIEAMNLNNVPIETSGKYQIYKLKDNGTQENEVLNGTFKTGVQKGLRAQLNKLVSGKYRIQITAKDSNGKEVEDKKDFLIFSYNDKRPPIETGEWLVKKNGTFSASQPAEILFGLTEKDVSILYQIYDKEKLFEEKRITLSNSNHMFKIPYKEEYGEQVYLSLTYVKNEKFYNKNISLKKVQEKRDDKLAIKLEVFRDRLRPGQEETWTISVKDQQGNPSIAEVLASMYDSSLDKLGSRYIRSWVLNKPYINNYFSPYQYYAAIDKYGSSYRSHYSEYDIERKYFDFDVLELFGFQFDNSSHIMIRGLAKEKNVPPPPSLKSEMEEVLVQVSMADVKGDDNRFGVDIAELKDHKVIMDENPATGGSAAKEEVQIRRNFNETAFFYPQLRTNEKGETLVSFTAPESNTRWKFRVLAYDKDMKSAQTEQYVVTQKELMVTPNMPRFVREGDKTSISTKISNLSDKAIDGKVYIEFFDPVTEKVIDLATANREQAFTLEKDASSSASWTFDVPKDIQLLGCRIIATSETFSDGEQHVLPVLSNRMMVTESMPFDVTEAGENTFVYEKLKNNQSATLTNYRLTLEYADNPAWYAVMALPVLSNPSNDDAISWFASYYVNSLGASMMQQYPRVANMIQAWQKQGGSKETLISKLQQDEEVKNILLAETPWVLDAKDETEQMQRLSLLFDLNMTKQKTSAATYKLKDLQDATGGWSWYKGFRPSRSITQYILVGYAHLQHVGMMQYGEDIKRMQISALNFLDKEITDDYDKLTKAKDWEKTSTISTNQLEYLYARSYYRDIPITQEARKAERFYTSVVMKNWKKLNMYERSILVPVLLKNGDKKLAQQIAKSIREYAVTDKSKGMYWPNNKDKQFASGIAVVNHTFYMEALRETGATDKEMDLMKQWLVKQKQVQVWNTTHGTINAIYALLATGTNWLDGESKPSAIQIGKQVIDTKNSALGTGYVKTSWDKAEISPDMATVKVTKEGEQPAYGALYWQYYEDLNKIEANKTNLNVEKQLYKATNSGLVSITESNPLQVGDKVTIRLTVRVDNDIDFVHLKDMRAPCFEPVESVSSSKWNEGTIYYQETRDASTNLFFDRLRKGTYVFEYSVYVNRTGTYSNGITTIQSLYAPEFTSHTKGITVTVK
ncbi:hypothetical protein D0T66_01760 [Dysgonomonas sp. 25]|nr:hypothetical protein [Dysgonomonas sp. 25]